jgi:hypothetical protein
MKNHIAIAICCSFLLSGCLVVGPNKGKRRHGVHSNNCHPSEYWDGHKCKHKKHRKNKHKAKKHKHKHKKNKH